MPKTRSAQAATHGRVRAAQVGGGLNHHKHIEILNDFKRLNTEEARAAFADKWIRLTSRNMDETWTAFYELLRIIRDRKLYENPSFMEDRTARSTFEEYWDQVVEKPFATWLELEQTYHFVQEHAPELMQRTFGEATREAKRLNGHGGDRRSADFQVDNVNLKTQGGNSKSYLRDRLERDYPDVFARLEAGEFRSARAAAIEAGIAEPSMTIPIDPKGASRAIAKRFSSDQVKKLIQFLSEGLR